MCITARRAVWELGTSRSLQSRRNFAYGSGAAIHLEFARVRKGLGSANGKEQLTFGYECWKLTAQRNAIGGCAGLVGKGSNFGADVSQVLTVSGSPL